MKAVLDAWALLALLQGEEPAAARVRALLQSAQRQEVELLISIINLGEVYYSVGKMRGQLEADETLDDIRRLPIKILPADDEIVLAAARIKMEFAVSYADAFAMVAAERFAAPLFSGDSELEALQGRINLEKLSRRR